MLTLFLFYRFTLLSSLKLLPNLIRMDELLFVILKKMVLQYSVRYEKHHFPVKCNNVEKQK